MQYGKCSGCNMLLIAESVCPHCDAVNDFPLGHIDNTRDEDLSRPTKRQKLTPIEEEWMTNKGVMILSNPIAAVIFY